MIKIRLGMFAAAIGATLLAFTPVANAIPVEESYTFFGDCTDCAGGHATLTLKAYSEGADITSDNFVSFDYLSDKFAMSVLPANLASITGNIASAPGSYLIDIVTNVVDFRFDHFHSETAPGEWFVGSGDTRADFGPTSCWNCAAALDTTPIPGAAMLFGSVFAGGAGFGAWRRRRKAPAAQSTF